MTVLRCIVCEKELAEVGSGSPNHASKANEFSAYGQYGSQVFDPMDGSRLVVNICDGCIVGGAKRGCVAEAAPSSRDIKPWHPGSYAKSIYG